MVEKLRDFLLTCPFLTRNGDGSADLRVDFTGENAVSYSLIISPSSSVVRQYVGGGGIKKLEFLFRSVETFSGYDIGTNENNLKFYEEFCKWLEQNEQPDIPDVVRIEAVTDGYVFAIPESADRAVYQVQCRLFYTF